MVDLEVLTGLLGLAVEPGTHSLSGSIGSCHFCHSLLEDCVTVCYKRKKRSTSNIMGDLQAFTGLPGPAVEPGTLSGSIHSCHQCQSLLEYCHCMLQKVLDLSLSLSLSLSL
ncbi:hypothetical protein O3P69_017412 [Scylla paramamosain]|uniref:Uncharacterized protein n=1 Tax=Scylla paramamosain TaxID=85552 RepID=A0AAW0SAP4_SCYPA